MSGESKCGLRHMTSIWDALKTCGIEHEYISLLKRLYRNQKATVMTDKESDMFAIKKGTPSTVL